MSKDEFNIVLGYTNYPIYITASLGDIIYDKKGLSHSYSYDCS